MVLTKQELIASLQHEVRILSHLAGKVDRKHVDYRPTPKQRSTLELLRYMSVMGTRLAHDARAGAFNVEEWQKALAAADARDIDQTVAAIDAQAAMFAEVLESIPDAAFREEVTFFGSTRSRGSFLVNVVLSGYAAYRTQLFNYLKACGREELTTMNLWAGMDAPPK
jgi:hypothetical protein